MNIAVVLSSGFGTRMKAKKNKTLLSIGRKPIIAHTIGCFEESAVIDEIILVVREEEKPVFEKIIAKYGLKKISALVSGGKERQHSAYHAVQHLANKRKNAEDMIIFHNGANPFVTEDEITSVIIAAQEHGAAAVAHPTKDTIKEVGKDGRVVKTLDRSVLWNMQTPQALRFGLAQKAFHKAHEDQHLGTDDVSLAEYIGHPVAIVTASENNFKITTPRDLLMAKLIIQEKNNLLKS
jgi:2-C-methyl-D-erythritol 4-phosphate cytidylyltransferase